MRTTLPVALVLCLLFFTSCADDDKFEQSVYRSKKNGKARQTIVTALKNPPKSKDEVTIQEEEFDPTTQKWKKLGPERPVSNADSAAETANQEPYNGDLDLPPNSASSTNPNNVYLANNYGNNDVIVLNAKTFEVVARIPTRAYVTALAASPDGLTIAVPAANRLLFIDVLTNRVSRSLDLAAFFFSTVKSIQYSRDGARLFLTDSKAGIRIVEASTAKLLQTIPLPAGISDLESSALSPDGEYLFVRTAGSNSSAIFDITTLSFTTGASVGRAILFSDIPCVFHETGKEIYCLSVDGISVIDAATMLLSGSIALPFLGPDRESAYRLKVVDGGAYLLVTTDKAVRMISPARRQILSTLLPGPNQFFTSAFPISRF